MPQLLMPTRSLLGLSCQQAWATVMPGGVRTLHSPLLCLVTSSDKLRTLPPGLNQKPSLIQPQSLCVLGFCALKVYVES